MRNCVSWCPKIGKGQWTVCGTVRAEINHKVGEVAKVLDVLRSVWKKRSLSIRAEMAMFDDIAVLTVLYGCKTWTQNANLLKMDEFEIKCLKTMCCVMRIDQLRNDIVSERCGCKHF